MSIALSLAVTVAPTWRSARDPLHPARVARARVALQQRLDVHVDARERRVRQAAQAVVEGLLVEVVAAVGPCECALQLCFVVCEDDQVVLHREDRVAVLVERRARGLPGLLRLRLRHEVVELVLVLRLHGGDDVVRRGRGGPHDDRVAEHRLYVVVEAHAAGGLLELLQKAALDLAAERELLSSLSSALYWSPSTFVSMATATEASLGSTDSADSSALPESLPPPQPAIASAARTRITERRRRIGARSLVSTRCAPRTWRSPSSPPPSSWSSSTHRS